jgi:hypothetical protein
MALRRLPVRVRSRPAYTSVVFDFVISNGRSVGQRARPAGLPQGKPAAVPGAGLGGRHVLGRPAGPRPGPRRRQDGGVAAGRRSAAGDLAAASLRPGRSADEPRYGLLDPTAPSARRGTPSAASRRPPAGPTPSGGCGPRWSAGPPSAPPAGRPWSSGATRTPPRRWPPHPGRAPSPHHRRPAGAVGAPEACA